jgi:NADP-dependent 3-hydroxy acid dehydrogenase YdfG
MAASEKRVAIVTGAPRSQGRCRAVALAARGMEIIAIGRCADIALVL